MRGARPVASRPMRLALTSELCTDVHGLALRAPRDPHRLDRARRSPHPAARSRAGSAGAGRADFRRRGRACHDHRAGAAAEPGGRGHQPRADHQPRLGGGRRHPLRLRDGGRRRDAPRAAAGGRHLAPLPAPHRRPAGAGHRRHGLAGHGRSRQQLRDQGRGAGRPAPRRAGDRGAGGPAEGLLPLLGRGPVRTAADRRRHRRGPDRRAQRRCRASDRRRPGGARGAAGQPAAHRRPAPARLRHPHRARARPSARALSRARPAARGRRAPGPPVGRGDLAHQDPGQARHRRAPPAAGRARPADAARPPHRSARRHGTLGARREPGHPHPGPERSGRRLPRSRPRPRPGAQAAACSGGTPRHDPGHRPDRQRQDHDALRRLAPPQQGQRQADQHRGPDRVPDRRHHPDPGQARDRARLRARPALGRPPRSGRDHGRRDARPRDRRHRGPRCADRPPAPDHAPHQQCRRCHRPTARHGCGALPSGLGAARHPGPAAGRHPVPGLQDAPARQRGRGRLLHPGRARAAGATQSSARPPAARPARAWASSAVSEYSSSSR